MILITTAGNVGSEAARLLVEHHVPVRVLVRDSGKAKALVDAGAQIAVGDLKVPESIDEAMAGVSGRQLTVRDFSIASSTSLAQGRRSESASTPGRRRTSNYGVHRC